VTAPSIFAQVVAEVLYRNVWVSDNDGVVSHAMCDKDAADVLHALATDPRVKDALSDTLTAHFGTYGPLFGTDHSVGCIRNAILAAFDTKETP